MTVTTGEEVVADEVRPPSRARELATRVGGVLVASVAAVVLAVAELILAPMTLGAVPVGAVAIPLAAGVSVALAWFAVGTADRRWALAPPWVLWTVVMMVASGARTTEGDFLVGQDDWVAPLVILSGSLAFAVYAYRLIVRGPRVTKS